MTTALILTVDVYSVLYVRNINQVICMYYVPISLFYPSSSGFLPSLLSVVVCVCDLLTITILSQRFSGCSGFFFIINNRAMAISSPHNVSVCKSRQHAGSTCFLTSFLILDRLPPHITFFFYSSPTSSKFYIFFLL